MSKDKCVVIGSAVMDYRLDKLVDNYDVIQASNQYRTHPVDYAVINRESALQELLNNTVFRDSVLLVPDALYKKYIFFDQVDALPSLPTVRSTGKNVESLSEQSLALMLALWMERKHVYLFGYDIENLNERAILLSIMGSNPFSQIYYVRKPNPNKIFLFDAYDHVSVIDYREFDRNAKK